MKAYCLGVKSSTSGGVQELPDTGVVVVPSLRVAATLDDTHVPEDTLDTPIADVVDTVIEEPQFETDEDCRREVDGKPALGATDSAGANASSLSDDLLCSVHSALLAQLSLLESIRKEDGSFLGQGSS